MGDNLFSKGALLEFFIRRSLLSPIVSYCRKKKYDNKRQQETIYFLPPIAFLKGFPANASTPQ